MNEVYLVEASGLEQTSIYLHSICSYKVVFYQIKNTKPFDLVFLVNKLEF